MLWMKWIIFAFCLVSVKCVAANVFNENYTDDETAYKKWMNIDRIIRNTTISSTKWILPYAIEIANEANISAKCMAQSFQLIYGFRNLKLWAFHFLDSSGKIIEGLFKGTSSNLGRVDECVDIIATKDNFGDEGEALFRGQYCLIAIKPPLPHKRRTITIDGGLEEFVLATKNTSELTQYLVSRLHLFFAYSLNLGVCVPSGCSQDDITRLADTLAGRMDFHAKATFCEVKKNNTLSKTATIIICIYSLVGLIVLIGTLTDFRIRKNPVKNKAIEVLVSFSLLNNFKKLINTKSADGSLACLYGIRVLTLAWIVLLHIYFTLSQTVQLHDNSEAWLDKMKSFGFQMIANGRIAVEPFFFLGGLLNCYLRIKEFKKTNKVHNVFFLIFYRLWRIYPAYIFTMLTLFLLPGSGPMFDQFIGHNRRICQKNWWTNIIFINNFYDYEETCFPPSWYIACDMQLFLVSLITIPVLIRYPKWGILLNSAGVIASMIFSGVFFWINKLQPTNLVYYIEPEDHVGNWRENYRPYGHAGPYFIGILVGYFFSEKKELKLSKAVQLVGWIIAIFLSCAALFGTATWNSGVKYTVLEASSYLATNRVSFILGVAWVVVCCRYGFGGPINYILSMKIWVPLSKLSYLIYLLSAVVQFYVIGDEKSVSNTNDLHTVWKFFGDLFASSLIALTFYLMVESPFISIEKTLFFKGKESKHETKTMNENISCKELNEMTSERKSVTFK